MSNFTYELPQNFDKRIIQYLQQTRANLAVAFKQCKYEFQDKGLAYYAGLRGDNWNKNAIDFTIEGNQENIELLQSNKNVIAETISKSLKSDESGLLLRNLYFLVDDEIDESIVLSDEIEEKFKEISNRQATFEEMSTDEKLAEIINLLENMLKKDGKFVALQYSDMCFDYISDEVIKKYRKQLHCFRHSSDEAIDERRSFSEEQKSFLIDFGLTIINVVHQLK